MRKDRTMEATSHRNATPISPQAFGVAYSAQRPEYDCYTGTKEQLVAAGICLPDWFPETLAKHKRGQKRTYYRVQLVQRSDTTGAWYWVVKIWTSDAERKRREDELKRQWGEDRRRVDERREREDQERRAQEAQEAAEIRRTITLAPPVTAASLTEAELRHIRILRTVGADLREHFLDLAEVSLVGEAKRGKLAWPQSGRPTLQIVVDNQAPPRQ
jgi:hypothetical protein